MVWALIQPSGFGDFFPDGSYVDREDRMTEYFSQMPPDFQAKFKSSIASYRNYASSKFTYEIGTKIGEKPPITPLEAHEKPAWLETEKNYSSLGSFLITENRLLVVDENLKVIIERLEPSVHVFWPIQITMPKGAVYPKQFYGMVIGQFLDSFVPEKSADGILEKENNYESYFISMETKQNLAGVAMSKSVFGTHHLWRERRLRRPGICFSDALQSEIAKAGLRMPKHFQMKEVE
jgi:hypothetical protein